MKEKRVYLIDATAFCYRAFFAVSGLSTSFGQPTNAIFGFVNMLNKILKEHDPQYLAACFDVSRETFRQKKYAEYKIQRPPMPEGLQGQFPLIKKIIAAYGIEILEKEGFEADDVIATLSKQAEEKGLAVTIISSDKDMLQLVNKNTKVFSPYKNEGTFYDEKKILERFGISAGQIPDILALMGDDVDNIPGAKGIGEKTAVELVKEFGSAENLLDNVAKIKQERLKKIVQENAQNIKLSKELAILDKDAGVALDLEKIKIGTPDYQELFSLFKYLEFKSFLKTLPLEEKPVEQAAVEKIEDKDLKEAFGKTGELFLFGVSENDLVFCAEEKIFRFNKLGAGIKQALADTKLKKIGHDLKKAKVSLAKSDLALAGAYFDTMIAAYLINPSAGGFTLADLAWNYLKEGVKEETLGPGRAIDLIIRLRPKLEEELREKELLKLFFDLEMPLSEVLAEIEINGIKLDLKLLKELSIELDKRLKELISRIYTISGSEFNINSPKQLREILFEKLKLPVAKRSKTGPSTDEEVLRKLAVKHALPGLILEYRQLMKLKTTYVDTLPDLVDKDTGRIHASFNQTTTETGRLSSTNPNLQNIPIKTEIGSKIRAAIIVSETNNFLLSFDYSQIELRILAHLSGDQTLLASFKQDKDVHKFTASLIYGIEENDVNEAMREVAKRINFGIVYGLSAYGLSRDLNIPVDEAQGFIDAYFSRYAGVKTYIDEQIKRVEDSGYATTILGRRRYLPEIKNRNMAIRQLAQRQAVNTPIQGSASDLIKLAMVDIQREIKNKQLKTKMLIQIHDELVFEIPQEELQVTSALVKERMENVLKLDVPIRVSIKKGKNWLNMEEVK
ncbi:MAG: DNA polymerase I [Candidatus Omnitrophica bacterium]|nr:DNA polymerase I [Candidatus Omnitrophota bacterium]MDD5652758.1 DNA polymerase I [Candidatus Omnitrophota bacterium]